MGFHIINIKKDKISSTYVDSYHELCFQDDIKDTSIIYQGEKHWKPCRVMDDQNYRSFAKDWFRAGLKAQAIFVKQAFSNQLIIEELNQTQEGITQYSQLAHGKSIKRGDYIIRNLCNIEIDVKCRTFYQNENNEFFFNFKCLDLEKHINMINHCTKTPVFIAVYERNGDQVLEHELYFFSVQSLYKHKSKLKKHEIYKNDTGVCFQIPLSYGIKGFDKFTEFIHKNRKK